jgi:hypothetical protein
VTSAIRICERQSIPTADATILSRANFIGHSQYQYFIAAA